MTRFMGFLVGFVGLVASAIAIWEFWPKPMEVYPWVALDTCNSTGWDNDRFVRDMASKTFNQVRVLYLEGINVSSEFRNTLTFYPLGKKVGGPRFSECTERDYRPNVATLIEDEGFNRNFPNTQDLIMLRSDHFKSVPAGKGAYSLRDASGDEVLKYDLFQPISSIYIAH